jgi:hypothetical protein
MKEYFSHLLANWKVALHSLNDFAEHFIHGLFPFISWKHYERNSGKYYDYRTVTGKAAKDLWKKVHKIPSPERQAQIDDGYEILKKQFEGKIKY